MNTKLTTRRHFLQKGMTLVAVGATVPTFLQQTLMALDNPLDVKLTQGASGKDGKILVVVQLSGGNDGLNTVIPYGDDRYHKARPTLGHDAKTVLRVDDYVGLHPNLGPMKDLLDKGRLAVVQGVGYPNPNRSHFRSMDIWQSGQPENETVSSGWLGRYFDNTCAGDDPHVGVSMGEQLPLAMRGERILPLSFEHPESYRYTGPDPRHYMALNSAVAPATQPARQGSPQAAAKKAQITAASQLDFLHRTAMDAQLSSDQILRITRGHNPAVSYPNGEFANGLKTIAAMIKGGMATRVYYVSLGGFDTHAGERARHDGLMTQLANGLAAFTKDLVAQKNDQRVLVMTFSEFGRRVEQNASGGTDHGAAAPMFIVGPAVKAGLVGRHPPMNDLDHGDLKYQIDFRSVYAAVLQNWLDAPSKIVLGQQFPLAPILRQA